MMVIDCGRTNLPLTRLILARDHLPFSQWSGSGYFRSNTIYLSDLTVNHSKSMSNILVSNMYVSEDGIHFHPSDKAVEHKVDDSKRMGLQDVGHATKQSIERAIVNEDILRAVNSFVKGDTGRAIKSTNSHGKRRLSS